MEFHPPLVLGRFIRRYKRFFVDVELSDGRSVVAHCPNTGSMRGCLVPGSQVALMPAANPQRKLAWTWVLVKIGDRWMGVDTGRAVPLVAEAIERDPGLQPAILGELAGYERMASEVKYGAQGRSRIDLLLSRGGVPEPSTPGRRKYTPHRDDERVYIEVKNTTLFEDPNTGVLGDDSGRGEVAAFPDAVTVRGQKHLRELMAVAQAGQRAVMIYVVQRGGCRRFRAAHEIDPTYAQLLIEAAQAGVELFAVRAQVSPECMQLDGRLEIVL